MGEWDLCAQQGDDTTPISRREPVPSLFLQELHISINEGGFLQQSGCWSFGSACGIQGGLPCAAWGGEEAQQWCWGVLWCF